MVTTHCSGARSSAGRRCFAPGLAAAFLLYQRRVMVRSREGHGRVMVMVMTMTMFLMSEVPL